MKRIARAILLVGTILSQIVPAEAANWNFTPYLLLGQSYTDNVNQASRGQEQDEFISLLNPGFLLIREKGRLQANVAYQMQNLYYAEESDFEIFHQLDAFGAAEIVQEHFFVDATSSISQQVIDAEQPAPLSNLSLSENRTDVITASVSPYVLHQFGSATQAIARYRYGIVNFDDNEVAGTTSDAAVHGGVLGIGSDPGERRLGWIAAYNQERVDFEGTDAVDVFEQAGLRADYKLTRAIGITALGGYEENEFGSTAAPEFEARGEFWEAGLRLQPSLRDLLEARYGERFFGNTFFFSWDRVGRRFGTRVSYSEDVTTLAQSLLGNSEQLLDYGTLYPGRGRLYSGAHAVLPGRGAVIDPETGLPEPGTPLEPDAGLPLGGLSLTSEVFLAKRLAAEIAFNTVKTEIAISVFQEDRDFVDVAESEDERVRGIETLMTWHVSPRTDVLVGADFARQDFDDDDQRADLIRAKLGLQRFIGSRTFARLEGTRNQRLSDNGLDEFVENVVVLSVTRLF